MARGLHKTTVEIGMAAIACGQKKEEFTSDDIKAMLMVKPTPQSLYNKLASFRDKHFLEDIGVGRWRLRKENLNDFMIHLNGGVGSGTPNKAKAIEAAEEWPTETLTLDGKNAMSLIRVASEEENKVHHLTLDIFLERYIAALTSARLTLKKRDVEPLTTEDKDSDRYLMYKTWIENLDTDLLTFVPPVGSAQVFSANAYVTWPEFKRELAIAFSSGDQQATRDKWSKINRLRYLGETTEELENEPAFDYNEANDRRAKIARDKALEKLAAEQSAERRIKEIDSHFSNRDPEIDGWDDEEDYQGATFYAEQDQRLFEWFCDLSDSEQRYVYRKFQDKTDMYYKPYYAGFTELMVAYLKGPPC